MHTIPAKTDAKNSEKILSIMSAARGCAVESCPTCGKAAAAPYWSDLRTLLEVHPTHPKRGRLERLKKAKSDLARHKRNKAKFGG